MTRVFLSYSSLKRVLAKAPEGPLKFTATSRQALRKLNVSQETRSRIINLMCNRRTDLKEYKKISREMRSFSYEAGEEAPVDYFRPILAKALFNIFRGLTPKYRNEAARKKFFQVMASLAENIHLTNSTGSMKELFESQTADKIVGYLIKEAAELIESGYSPDLELNDRLMMASQEFQKYIMKMETLTGVKWEESDGYIEGLRITSFFDPWVVENEKTVVWGVQYYPDEHFMNIAPPFIFFDTLRKAIIAREAARLYIPSILSNVEYIYEQAEYLAYKFLEDRHEKEFWYAARHGLRQETRKWSERIRDFFTYYEGLVGDDLYKDIYSRLAEFKSLSIPLKSQAEYSFIFETLAARPAIVKFDEKELELLKILSISPQAPASKISRDIGLSIPTTMKLIRDLTKKAFLGSMIMTNMGKLGLREYLLFIETHREWDTRRLFWAIPYCRDAYRLYGPTDLFIVLDVPFKNENFVPDFLKLLEEKNIVSSYLACKPKANFYNINFSRYDGKTNLWNIRWDSWALGLREEILKKNQERDQPVDRGISYEPKPIEIDKIDLQIMDDLVFGWRRSFSDIGSKIGVSGAYVGKKVRRLIKNDVLKPMLISDKMGAENCGYILVDCDQTSVNIIARYLDELPAWRGCQTEGDINGIAAMVWVPMGEVEQLFKTIDDQLCRRKLINKCLFHSVGKWSSLRRWLPIDLYVIKEGWAFDEKKYFSFVDKIA
jgi:DNA-binding Lrp family transcriptional regulator